MLIPFIIYGSFGAGYLLRNYVQVLRFGVHWHDIDKCCIWYLYRDVGS